MKILLSKTKDDKKEIKIIALQKEGQNEKNIFELYQK
jgi:hypothetical protein